MSLLQNNSGSEFKTDKFITFFGNKIGTFEFLKKTYSEFDFAKIKQTHSDLIVTASSEPVEADAHVSSQKNQALLIATADCMPIMIYCEQTNRVAAVHAGWRGVANRITVKTLTQMINTGSTDHQFKILVGPSILQKSFEVDFDVFEKLRGAAVDISSVDFSYKKDDKYYVNLNTILMSQIKSVINSTNIIFADIDTKTDLNYHSYRRDKQATERNLSFICLLS